MIDKEKMNKIIRYLVGTKSDYEIEGNFIFSENAGLDTFGISYIDTEEKRAYNYFYCENITSEYPETKDMKMKEKFEYLMKIIPWGYGECSYQTFDQIMKIVG
jgi:hypothetical protein